VRVLYISEGLTVHDERFIKLIVGGGHTLGYVRLAGKTSSAKRDSLAVEWWRDLQPAGLLELVSLAREMESAIDAYNPDLVHAGPMHYGAFLAALAGFHPLVSVSWGSDVLLHAATSPAVASLARYALDGSDGVLCDCDAVRDALRDLSTNRPLIAQFPWGIEVDTFLHSHARQECRSELGWKDGFVVFTSRAWASGYDVDIALAAVFEAMRDNPSVRLLLAGDGPLRAEIDSQIRASGLADRIHRIGLVSQAEVARYLAASDLYLSCTPMDGSSISLMEAMASGLPAITADAGGNREWIRTGWNGWLVKSRNINGFASAILQCADLDLAERRAIGSRNREAMETRGDWKRNSQRLLDLYESLQARAGVSAGKRLEGGMA